MLLQIIPLLFLLLFGALLNSASSSFIGIYYPERPLVPDLLFDLSPDLIWTQYLSDPAAILSFFVFVIVLRKNFTIHYIKEIFLSFALSNIMRALIIPLTPLGRHYTNNQPYGIFPVIQHGMFPSGHTTATFLLFLLVPKEMTRLKSTMLIFFIVQVFILITSRGHYSIDIIGGMMVAYISLDVTKKYLANKK